MSVSGYIYGRMGRCVDESSNCQMGPGYSIGIKGLDRGVVRYGGRCKESINTESCAVREIVTREKAIAMGGRIK